MAEAQVVNINLTLQKEIFAALKGREANVAGYFKRHAALDAYRQGKLSFGQAAKLADMTKTDFLQYLSQHKVSLFRYTREELEQETVDV